MYVFESLREKLGNTVLPALSLIDPEEYTKGKTVGDAIRKLWDIQMRYDSLQTFMEKRKENSHLKIKCLSQAVTTVKNIERLQKRMKQNKEESKKSREVFIPLETSLLVKGEMNPSDTVIIKLTDDVMVELQFDKAIELLNKNLEMACYLHKHVEEELEHVKKQVHIANKNFWSVIAQIERNNLKKKPNLS